MGCDLEEEVLLHLTSKHLVFPQPAEALCALSHGKCPVGQLHFRVVVTKSVETLRPLPEEGAAPPGGGRALRPRV